MSLVLLVLVALVAVQPVGAQAPVSLQAGADQDSVTVGDRIRVTVTLTLPADAQADLTTLEQQFGDLDLLFVGLPSDRLLGDGRREVKQELEVAAFQVGTTEVPALSLSVRLAGGETVTAASQPIPIDVRSVIPAGENPTDVRDLKPQVSLETNSGLNPRYVWLGVGAAALLLVAALLLWRRLRRPRMMAVPLPGPVASPEAVARAELERIEGLGLLDSGDVKQFHALMAACIRRYLTARYNFPAFAMTTSELRRHMEPLGVDRWQARLVLGLLTESDAANFAQYVPARTRCEANLEIAHQIIDAGEPKPEEAPQEAVASAGS